MVAAVVGALALAAGGVAAYALSGEEQTTAGDAPTATATPTPTPTPTPTVTVPPPTVAPSTAPPTLKPTPTATATKVVQPEPEPEPEPEPTVVNPPPPPPTTQANRAPSIAAVPAQSHSELADVSLALRGSDPDSDALAWSASNLPRGLSISRTTGVITGSISVDAAAVTRDRRIGIQTRSLTAVVVVTDGKAQASRSISWKVKDTHLRMPDYRGKLGCAGDPGCAETSPPNVQAVSVAGFGCTTTGGVNNERIASQSVGAGSTHAWGARAVYTYQRASCP